MKMMMMINDNAVDGNNVDNDYDDDDYNVDKNLNYDDHEK